MLIQISSGRGPKECERACFLYMKYLMKEYNKDIEILSIEKTSKDCIKSAVLSTKLDLSHLVGTVLWICKSPFRPNHKRKNWYISVSILEKSIDLDISNSIKYEAIHSRGKGGQHINKSSTGIRAIHIPTGISVVSMQERSQYINKKIATIKLKDILKQKNILISNRINYQNWLKHPSIIRGTPTKIYTGTHFKEKS